MVRKRYNDLQKYDFRRVPPYPANACRVLEKAYDCAIKVDNIQNTLIAIDKVRQAIEMSKQEYERVELEFKEKADVCPLCGNCIQNIG